MILGIKFSNTRKVTALHTCGVTFLPKTLVHEVDTPLERGIQGVVIEMLLRSVCLERLEPLLSPMTGQIALPEGEVAGRVLETILQGFFQRI